MDVCDQFRVFDLRVRPYTAMAEGQQSRKQGIVRVKKLKQAHMHVELRAKKAPVATSPYITSWARPRLGHEMNYYHSLAHGTLKPNGGCGSWISVFLLPSVAHQSHRVSSYNRVGRSG